MSVQLHCGDCLEIMPTIEAGSVDCIVTDPPYGQTNEGYDSDIAFRPDVWKECFRLARPGSALVAFAGSPTYHRIASAIEAGGWKVRQMWGWVYRDGFMTSAWPKEGFDRLSPAFDPICFATKGKVLLNLEREGERDWDRSEPGRLHGRNGYSSRSGSHGVPRSKGHWPRSIVALGDVPEFQYFILSRTMGGHGWAGEKTGHPNQKPVVLMDWIVQKIPGGCVLDPFSGSGTTGVACVRTDRDFIGIEIDGQYNAIATARIEFERAKTPLFSGLESG